MTIDADNNLVIEMVSKEEKEETNTAERHYLRKEFSRMQFKQMIRIPENIKREHISAVVEHGILTIELPKVTEEEKKAAMQTIEIK